MNLSINDLIVPMERPGNGLRDLVSQSALTGASPLSIAAFGGLLDRFAAAGREAPPTGLGEAPVHPTRPAAKDRPVAPDRTGEAPDPIEPVEKDEHAALSETDATAAPDQSSPDRASIDKPATAGVVPVVDLPQNAHSAVPPGLAIATAASGVAREMKPDGGTPGTPTPAALATQSGTQVKDEAHITAASAGQGTAPPLPVAGQQRATTADAAPARLFQLADLAAPGLGSASGEDISVEAAIAAAIGNTAKTQPGSRQGTLPDSGKHAVLSPTANAGQTVPAKAEDGAMPAIGDDVLPATATVRSGTGHGLLAAQEIETAAGTKNGGVLAPGGNANASGGGATQAANGQTPASGGLISGTDAVPAASVMTAGVEGNRANALRPIAGNGLLIMAGPNGVQAGLAGPGQLLTSLQSAARAPGTAPVPLDEVAVHIARAAASGSDHITIKLKPAALGQVDVKLELTHDGRVVAVITAERSDTLDMLARDAKSLERALAEAGLKTDSGSLQFNLRGDGGNTFGRDNLAGEGDSPMPTSLENITPESTAPAAAISGYLNARSAIGGIDIRV